jgi:hypothetical protein
MNCLNCNREFPAKITGDVEPGGFMLCIGCGHVMIWTDELTLRELTESERIDAGGHHALMQARSKIIPSSGVRHPGSWAMSCVFTVIVVMVVLERIHVIPLLHHAR